MPSAFVLPAGSKRETSLGFVRGDPGSRFALLRLWGVPIFGLAKPVLCAKPPTLLFQRRPTSESSAPQSATERSTRCCCRSLKTGRSWPVSHCWTETLRLRWVEQMAREPVERVLSLPSSTKHTPCYFGLTTAAPTDASSALTFSLCTRMNSAGPTPTNRRFSCAAPRDSAINTEKRYRADRAWRRKAASREVAASELACAVRDGPAHQRPN